MDAIDAMRARAARPPILLHGPSQAIIDRQIAYFVGLLDERQWVESPEELTSDQRMSLGASLAFVVMSLPTPAGLEGTPNDALMKERRRLCEKALNYKG
jgi:hypothetical protein